jgi:hypothetical protein
LASVAVGLELLAIAVTGVGDFRALQALTF